MNKNRFSFYVQPLHLSGDQPTAGIRTQSLFFPERLFLICWKEPNGQKQQDTLSMGLEPIALPLSESGMKPNVGIEPTCR
jgi:hypothetical protein